MGMVGTPSRIPYDSSHRDIFPYIRAAHRMILHTALRLTSACIEGDDVLCYAVLSRAVRSL